MSDFIRNYNQEEFIVPPFSIDNKATKKIDDCFSITCNCYGNYSLNIHITNLACEYIKSGYSIYTPSSLERITKIGENTKQDLVKKSSLQKGKKKVLTLKLENRRDKYLLYYALCEKIIVSDNFCYGDNIPDQFLDIISDILPSFNYQNNNNSLVYCFMNIYSSVFSHFLFDRKNIYYNNRNRPIRHRYKKGNFTAPLNNEASLLNQLIFLQKYGKDLVKDNGLKLQERSIYPQEKREVSNGSAKTLVNNFSPGYNNYSRR